MRQKRSIKRQIGPVLRAFVRLAEAVIRCRGWSRIRNLWRRLLRSLYRLGGAILSPEKMPVPPQVQDEPEVANYDWGV
jgi:hypothetical protein